MRFRVSLFFLVASLFCLSACGGQQPQPPSRRVQDNGQRLYIDAGTGLYKVRASDGKLLWWWNNDLSAGQGRPNPPIVTKVGIFALDSHGNINALDEQTAKIRWTTPVSEATTFTADSADVYVGAGLPATIYRIDPTNGQATWKLALPAGDYDNVELLLSSQGMLYTLTAHNLYAVDEAGGQVKWQIALDQFGINTLEVVGGVLVSSALNGVTGLDPATGKTEWDDAFGVKTQSFAPGEPIIQYIDQGQHRLYCYYTSTGSLSLAGSSGLLALDTKSGSVVWSQAFDVTDLADQIQRVITPQGAFEQMHGQQVDQVQAYSLQDGHILWTADAAPPTQGMRTTESNDPVAYIKANSQVVYAETSNGAVYAYDPTSGKLRWYTQDIASGLLPKDDGGAYVFGFGSKGGYSITDLLPTGKVEWRSDLPTASQIQSINTQDIILFPFQE